ncbi:MAG: heme exporter protein CcmD [Aestuariivita sp.]|nr:heme exporter protein CcmD [Aestuariivita sp.]MCY4201840.1 heme exporter protein CcmD [Aestuariivita sp.]MCY4287540.1 heme exporter protein CcmD [Aestuariivita sp.]MCY4347114.1 heme exporter protein CcmD [Aestuariivita sp.]
MFPDLGKYADVVLSAYAVTATIMAVIVLVTLVRGKRVRSNLRELEIKQEENG